MVKILRVPADLHFLQFWKENVCRAGNAIVYWLVFRKVGEITWLTEGSKVFQFKIIWNEIFQKN